MEDSFNEKQISNNTCLLNKAAQFSQTPVCQGDRVLLISNAARQAVRTINFMKILHKKGYEIYTIAWKRNQQDRCNQEEYSGAKTEIVRANNIFFYIIKALLLGLRYPSNIYVTVDIRLVPVIIILARVNKKAVAIYDSKELPSVTAQAYLDTIRWPKLLMPIKKIILNLYDFFENKCFKMVDGILCLDSRDDFLLHKARAVNENAEVIMNTVKIDYSLAQKGYENFRKIYENETAVVFSGHLYPDKGLIQYLKMTRILIDEIPNLRLVLCGSIGINSDEFRKMLIKYGVVEYVDVYKRLPFDEHIGLLKCCKVGLALMRLERPKFKMIGPGTAQKIFTYMAAGLPVITSKGHFAKIIEEEECGIAVDFFNTYEFIDAVRHLLISESDRKRMAVNALKATRTKYNMDIENEKICRIIDRAFAR